jgi:monothiol glutaredoxin
MADTISERIQADITANDVMLYMKGTPMFPQCGFSARVIQILTHMGVPFQSANVLEDPELRDGIKSFSQWPTIPQLYVKGMRYCQRDVPKRRVGDAVKGARRSCKGVAVNRIFTSAG